MTLVIRFEAGLRPILKHGDHDQKTHGNWATGGGDTAINKFETRQIRLTVQEKKPSLLITQAITR
jgi:hypothetical protein